MRLLAPFVLLLAQAEGNEEHGYGLYQAKQVFNRVSTYLVCSLLDPNCNVDTETVAEIVVATDDGKTIIYTDSELDAVGFVDISDPSMPEGLEAVDLVGEPTSVGIVDGSAIVAVNTSPNFTNPSGQLDVINLATREIYYTIDLGGQPDSLAVSGDRKYAAVAIENERDEDLGDGQLPQLPPGSLVIIEISDPDPTNWVVSNVDLTGLTGCLYMEDPEPEFVHINENNECIITLQENNCIAIVDLETKLIIDSFSAGTVSLTQVDNSEDSVISQTESIETLGREPDGIQWIGTNYFATANEGDLDGGTRGFTIFERDGTVVYDSGNKVEHLTARLGHYPEERSENNGNEPENIFYAEYGKEKFLFVVSERSSLILLYDVKEIENPHFVQALPSGYRPEGITAITHRNILVVAGEKDSRGDKYRSSITIYEYGNGPAQYPTLKSVNGPDGTPIPFGAISGLAAWSYNTLYAVEDSFYKKNRIFKIDTARKPAKVIDEIQIRDDEAVLSSVDLYGDFTEEDRDALVNKDGTVNLDLEGVAVTKNGFWVVSEGSGTVGDVDEPIESLNFLLNIDLNGVIKKVVTLPDDINDMQRRFGFEGVATQDHYVIVGFQRQWGSEQHPRLGIYNTRINKWKFLFYPLDPRESQNGGWVGISDITRIGRGSFLVLERDNQAGPDAVIKRIYRINLGYNLAALEDETLVKKSFFCDLVPDLLKPGGLLYEKVEGLAFSAMGTVWVATDNDGVDDSNGETQLLTVCADRS